MPVTGIGVVRLRAASGFFRDSEIHRIGGNLGQNLSSRSIMMVSSLCSIQDTWVMSDPKLNLLIQLAGRGDRSALDDVWPGLYAQLHDIASGQMAKERSGHLLQTTAVVHEAYFRLSDQQRSDWKDKPSFLAAAAVVMRRILIDTARRERSQKRGGNSKRQVLSETSVAFDDHGYSAIEVHEALEQLAKFAPDQARALELMIFGGLTGEEVAGVLGVSASTIDRKVRAAKAWLRRELTGGDS